MSPPEKVFDTLVFSGGGACAMVFVGCVRYLEHIGLMPSVRTVVGSSAGAIMAFLLALGLTADDLTTWIKEHSYPTGSGRLNTLDVSGIFELPERLGLDDGSNIDCCLRDALHKRFSVKDVTFVELAKLTGVNVVICASNLTLIKEEFFSVHTTPDVSVMTALRMSYSLPVLMTPVVHNGCIYVDGALFDNCPLDFPRADSFGRALVLNLINNHSNRPKPGALEPGNLNLVDYLIMIVDALVTKVSSRSRMTSTEMVEIVDINLPPNVTVGMFNMETFGFDVSDALLDVHSDIGYAAVKKCASLSPT